MRYRLSFLSSLAAGIAIALAALPAQAQHVLRVHFETAHPATVTVYVPGQNADRRSLNGGTYDQTYTTNASGNLSIVVSAAGSYWWTFDVWVDGREQGLHNCPQMGTHTTCGNGFAWFGQNFGPFNFAVSGAAPAPPAQPSPTPGQPGPTQSAPVNLTVTPQLLQAAWGYLTSASPMTSAAPLTSAAPFTMPIGSNLNGMSVQSLDSSCDGASLFQKTYGHMPTSGQAVAVDLICTVMKGYAEAFGRLPSMGSTGELHYWVTGYPRLTLAELESANSNWLRGNASERAATINRAFQAVLHREPNSQEFATWNNTVAQQGTLYKTIISQLRALPPTQSPAHVQVSHTAPAVSAPPPVASQSRPPVEEPRAPTPRSRGKRRSSSRDAAQG